MNVWVDNDTNTEVYSSVGGVGDIINLEAMLPIN